MENNTLSVLDASSVGLYKKCPFCGSIEIEIHREHDRSVHNHGEFYYWAECRGCEAKGPIESEHCFAEEAWNKRPHRDEIVNIMQYAQQAIRDLLNFRIGIFTETAREQGRKANILIQSTLDNERII